MLRSLVSLDTNENRKELVPQLSRASVPLVLSLSADRSLSCLPKSERESDCSCYRGDASAKRFVTEDRAEVQRFADEGER